MIFLVILLALIVLFAAAILVTRHLNGNRTRITSAGGISESTYVKLGGISQFINIRGQNANNPVILFLHGGPGGAVSFIGYYWQGLLEKDYTIVHWDQRGCGRTYYENFVRAKKAGSVSADGSPAPSELSKGLLLSDLDELVDYLRDRMGQDKITIMGHSWGTVLGSEYVRMHSSKTAAYIGVGQAVDMPGGETLVRETTILRAEYKGKKKDIKRLNALYDIFSTEETNMKNFMKIRSLTSRYLTCQGAMPGWKMIWTGITSPDMTSRDFRWQMLAMINRKKYFDLQAPLRSDLFTFNLYAFDMEYELPMFFISGDGDWITPYPLVRKYAKSVKAPRKEMVLIENTGHNPYLDNPEAFCKAVRKVLK